MIALELHPRIIENEDWATVLFIVSASSPAATGKLKADVVIQNITE